MKILELDKEELQEIRKLLGGLALQYETAADEKLFDRLSYYATFLPKRVREFYSNLKKEHAHSGMTLIRGFRISLDVPSPSSWNYKESYLPKHELDFLSMLLSSLVGHPFGWATQQKGKIIHDLIPQVGKGDAQTGYGSSSELELHTEDSFHDLKADFVCMYCMRNEQKVPTTFVTVRSLNIEKTLFDSLYGSQVELLPDESHLDTQQMVDGGSAMQNSVSKVKVLYGNKDYPYITYDLAYTNFKSLKGKRLTSFQKFRELVEDNIEDYALLPGDICIIDNRKVLHGRRKFAPNFDGQDRWLKRINITTNLRKSASARKSLSSRVIE